MVSPTVDGLDVRDEPEGEWRCWHWERVEQGDRANGDVELVCGGESVRVADRTMIDSIHRIAPATRGRLRGTAAGKLGWIVAIYVAGALAALGAAWLLVGWAGEWAAGAAPREWEKKIGQSAIAQFAPPGAVCADAELHLALQSMLARLRVGVPAEAGEFDVRVVDRGEVNAFTLPGGYIVVERGLLRSADAPEELAGVLAHEMQHAMQRHTMKALGRQVALWSVVAWFTGGADALAGRMAGELAGLKLRREDEFAADAGALELLRAARIDAGGFLAFFEKLSREPGEAPWLASAVATHPATSERMERIRAWRKVNAYPVQPLMDASRWEELRARCSSGGTDALGR